jgi:hypothetical protein
MYGCRRRGSKMAAHPQWCDVKFLISYLSFMSLQPGDAIFYRHPPVVVWSETAAVPACRQTMHLGIEGLGNPNPNDHTGLT